jgi:hypothetical protein
VLSGTPTTPGTVTLTFTASNGASPDATLSLAITVLGIPVPVSPASPATTTTTTVPATTTTVPATTGLRSPSFTSLAKMTGTVGHTLRFKVTASGYPVPTLAHSALPSGLKWTASGNGTAIISGAPKAGAAGVTKVTITASNTAGKTKQILAITVKRPAGLSNGKPPAATVGHPYRFVLKAYGYPTPSLAEHGALPAGMKFTNEGQGKALLSGVPAPQARGAHKITINVTNSLGTAKIHYTINVH